MIISLIIGFRETLEAALIIGIIFSYLKKIKRTDYLRFVLYGIIAGILTSILGAIIFSTTKQGFSGRSEQIFEGIAMILGSIMISSMILWMIHQNKFRQEMEEKIEIEIKDNHKWGVFSLTFISILREGVELVIFLNVSAINDGDYSLLGGFIGILIAIIIGYFLFKGFIRLNLKEFFVITGIFLIIVSAGLLAHGIHELQEAKIIPTLIEHIYDVNNILDEKSTIGNIFKSLFGYNGNPSLLESLSYNFYIIGIISVWKIDISSKSK